MIRGYCSFMFWFCGTVAFAEVTFEKKTLSERFVAEGCAVADFDKDGHADITAGNTIWPFEDTRSVDMRDSVPSQWNSS